MTLSEARAIAERLAQRGVVAVSALTAAGVSPTLVRKLKRPPASSPVYGVLRLDDRPLTPTVRAEVVRALAGDGVIISGWIACVLRDLRWVSPGPRVTGLVPETTQRRSRSWIRIRRAKSYAEIRTTAIDGLVVAEVAWAVVDASREISERRDLGDVAKLREVRGLVLHAVHRGLCSPADVLRVLGLSGTQHSALARRAARDAERGAVSPPEAEMADDGLTLGVPFLLNVEVWLDGEFLGIVDGWLIGTGVGWESDSQAEHAEDDKLDATLVRSERFRVGGLHLAHVTPKRYRRERMAWWQREVIAEVRRRQALGLGDPPGLELRNPRGPVLYVPRPDPPYRVPEMQLPAAA